MLGIDTAFEYSQKVSVPVIKSRVLTRFFSFQIEQFFSFLVRHKATRRVPSWTLSFCEETKKIKIIEMRDFTWKILSKN